ncbi:MAG: TonB-dependent receptor domain-containing protein, partial [Gemmatimonadaceae bacterium]
GVVGGGESEIIASVHAGGRSLYNPLTFAIVDLDRASYGAGLRVTLPLRLGAAATRWSAGVDLQEQDDERRNFENCNDTVPLLLPTARCPDVSNERGALLLDQQEIITSAGVFLRGEVAFAQRYRVTLGARADDVKFKVEDRLIIDGTNPDDSGERSLSALSPVAGVVARVGRQTAVYANVSSAFETPTATELANQPDGSAGLNRDLKPQYATSYEIGLKGEAAARSSRIQYDVAVFVARVRDELIPFEVTDIPGRRYFRNAGRTDRRGAEAGLSATGGPVEAGAAYSYSDFEFVDYSVDGVSYAGNRIPGVPGQQLQLYATWRRRGIFTTLEGMSSGRVAANDANSAHVAAYYVMNARAGGSLEWRRSSFKPVIGLNNVFGRRYTASVSVNALGGRYHEPSPGRVVFGGLTLVFGGADAHNR